MLLLLYKQIGLCRGMYESKGGNNLTYRLHWIILILSEIGMILSLFEIAIMDNYDQKIIMLLFCSMLIFVIVTIFLTKEYIGEINDEL